jgi:hypothetical protein
VDLSEEKTECKEEFLFLFFMRTLWIEASGNGSYHDLLRVLGVELELRSLKIGIVFCCM